MYNSVMIIDDNPVDRYIAEITILKTKFAAKVIQMDSAISALDYLSFNSLLPEELPQVIFLDINMPEINGFGFLEAFEQLPTEVQKIAIHMLSSSLDPEDQRRVTENKFALTYVSKPLKKEKLYEMMDEMATDNAVI